jgi:hypothetical protein
MTISGRAFNKNPMGLREQCHGGWTPGRVRPEWRLSSPHSTGPAPTGEGSEHFHRHPAQLIRRRARRAAVARRPQDQRSGQGRENRGRAIAAVCRIEERKPGLWVVPAQSSGGSYWVRTDNHPPTCTCEDFAKREKPCKHIHAIRLLVEQRAGAAATEPVALPEPPDVPEPLTLRKQVAAPAPPTVRIGPRTTPHRSTRRPSS